MEVLDTPVSTAMTTDVQTIDPGASVRDLASVLAEEGIGSVLVVTNERGILTKTDVIRALSDGVDLDATPVSALMSTDLVTVAPDDSLQTAVGVMDRHGIKRVVVEQERRVVGILTTTDIRAELSPDLDEIVGMFVDD